MSPAADALVWYAAFGSNLSADRLGCYVMGGRPPGAMRDYEGCRDKRPPARSRAITLPGTLCFGGTSSVWGGGMAFYVAGDDGVVHARAYLLLLEQLEDLVAQEARRSVGRPLVLSGTGRTHHGLSRVYDVVLELEPLEGHRVLTLTSSRDHAPNPPSPAYLRTMMEGLADGFGLDVDARLAYLASAGGMSPTLTDERLRALLLSGAD